MANNLFLPALLALAVLASGCTSATTGTTTTTTTATATTQATTTTASAVTTTTTATTTTQPSVKEIQMTASQWKFEPSEITVNQGDTVRLEIKNIDVAHGFSLSEFGISKQLPAGATTTVEFAANKKGTFTFFCSVFCGSGHGGMTGKLVVQ
ncbi:MAG: cupredoxin domain-containing protein [Candidatus Aenigmarchaeota archaeon]|nr:cupredoxin domain-containing protein [Candidatus Aenigmarchaeota archaeon]